MAIGIKTGGRKKGTPNKKTFYLNEFFENKNIQVPHMILDILPELSSEKKVDVLLKIMEFIYPKQKAIDFHRSDEDDFDKKSNIDLKLLSKEELIFLRDITIKAGRKASV